MKLNRSMMLATNTNRNIPWWGTILIAFGIFFIGQIVASMILVPVFLAVFPNMILQDFNKEPYLTLFSLLIFPFLLIFCLLINKFIYQHPIQSMGFYSNKLISKYLFGIIAGMLIILMIYVINLLFGAMNSTLNPNIQWLTISWLIALFMIQGFTEEVIARGFLMNKLAKQIGIPLAIFINSLFFSILHILNPNVSFFSLVNIFLAGIVFSLLFYWSDNIWFTGAVHSFWNLTLGVFIGNEVSGQRLPGTIFNSVSNKDLSLINGGSFGLEGGIVVTVISIILIGLLLKLSLNKYDHQKGA